MASRPNASNEIHDLDVVTAQNLTSPASFNVPRVGAGVRRHRNFTELFPPFLFKKVVSEVISTFLLVFVTCGAGALNKSNPELVSQLGASVAGGLIVTVMIYAVGHISGAHMNPAVTLAFAVARQFPWIQVPFFWGAQITGSTIASFILRGVLYPVRDLGTTTPSHAAWRALIIEVVVTFNMMFVTLAVATDTRAVGELAGLAVGSAVCITSIFAGPISGGSMNPARTLGPALASGIYSSLWVYFIGPPMGTVLAALAYNFIRLRPDGGQSLTQSESQSPSLKMRRLKKQESEMVCPAKEGDLDDGSV